MPKCTQCPDRAQEGTTLCPAHVMYLAYSIAAVEDKLLCHNCGTPYGFTEARVLRHAVNPTVGSKITPKLCWVCTRLHASAQDREA